MSTLTELLQSVPKRERKTRKHATVTVSVTGVRRYYGHVTLTVTLERLLVL